jgi:hypothetical protein
MRACQTLEDCKFKLVGQVSRIGQTAQCGAAGRQALRPMLHKGKSSKPGKSGEMARAL